MQRLLPDQRAPATAEIPVGTPATDVAWLEPYPESNLEGIADDAPNPETRYASREACQTRFRRRHAAVTAAPVRGALLLCDVLGWLKAIGATAALCCPFAEVWSQNLISRFIILLSDGTGNSSARFAPERQRRPHAALCLGKLLSWSSDDSPGVSPVSQVKTRPID
jgi:hypothetical protein